MANSIPCKDRPEWKQMIDGEIKIEYRNYVLQMQLTQMNKAIKNNQLTYGEAIDKLYALCSKYALAIQTDFKQIFKTW